MTTQRFVFMSWTQSLTPDPRPPTLKYLCCRHRCGDSAPPSAQCARGTSATSPACRTTWGRAASTRWSTKRSRYPCRPCAPPGASSRCATCCVTSAPDHADAHQTEITPPNHFSNCVTPPSAKSLEEHDAWNLLHWSLLLWIPGMTKMKKKKRIYLCAVACRLKNAFIWTFLNLMHNTFLFFCITYSNNFYK